MNLTLLKIGGSIITKKDSSKPEVNYKELKRICKEIKKGLSTSLVLIHGAGSYGHVIVKKTGIHKGIKSKNQVIGFAETQRLQNELNSIICKELINVRVPAIPLQPSSTAVMKQGKLVNLDTGVIKSLLGLGLVPVLYGVPAYDEVMGCSILSGDQLITYLAKELNPISVIHACDVNGVYDKDPNKFKHAKLIKKISSLSNISVTGSNHTDITGGMFGKVKELLDAGVSAEIINGLKPGLIEKALKGIKGLGTSVLFTKSSLS